MALRVQAPEPGRRILGPMVRPDDERQLGLRFEEGLESGSMVPAGEGPVPVSAGAVGVMEVGDDDRADARDAERVCGKTVRTV